MIAIEFYRACFSVYYNNKTLFKMLLLITSKIFDKSQCIIGICFTKLRTNVYVVKQ